jgi:cysteine desulfurase
MSKPIYLDYNATTPIAPEVAEAMRPCLGPLYGNPSSSHALGVDALLAVEDARDQVAGLLGCDAEEVVFTSGGTESNNYALKGLAWALGAQRRHVVTSAVEHPAVSEVCGWLAKQGYDVTILPVDGAGLVDPADLERVMRHNTLVVSIMHANNEVGTIQPIAELAAIAHRFGALLHTDAAQSVGKIPVQVQDLGVDLLTVAGHKLYAPKGIGALYVRQGVTLANLLHGAGHERGHRPGTENLLEIVGLGAAAQLAARELPTLGATYAALRDRLHRRLIEALGPERVRLNGHPTLRLPNTLSVSFCQVEANTLLARIGDQVAASAGAACHAGSVATSAVLQAMQVPLAWAMGTVRFSVGRATTVEEIDRAAEIVVAEVHAWAK